MDTVYCIYDTDKIHIGRIFYVAVSPNLCMFVVCASGYVMLWAYISFFLCVDYVFRWYAPKKNSNFVRSLKHVCCQRPVEIASIFDRLNLSTNLANLDPQTSN